MIRRISRTRRISLPPIPLSQARGSKLLAVAAALDELRLSRRDLPVKQEIRLVDQADQRVGAYGGVGMLQPRSVKRPSLLICQIRQIRPIRQISFEFPRHFPHSPRLRAVWRPLRQAPVTQEVLELEQQLLQARPGHVEKAQLGLRRGRRRAAPLGDVLPA